MSPIYVGKESNRWQEVEQRTIHDWEEVRSEYYDPNEVPWRTIVMLILKMMNGPELARLSRVTERHITRLRPGKQMPSPVLREVLTRAAREICSRKDWHGCSV